MGVASQPPAAKRRPIAAPSAHPCQRSEQQLRTIYTVDTVRALQPPLSRHPFRLADGQRQSGTIQPLAAMAGHCSPLVPIAVVQRPGSILAPLNAPLVRCFGMVAVSGAGPPLVVLDGARRKKARPLRAQALGRPLRPC